MNKLQGSQFSVGIDIPAFGYNDCEEIEIVLFNKRNLSKKITYKKSTGTVMNSSGYNLTIDILVTTTDSKTLALGDVFIEVKRTVSGIKQPVIKSKLPVFTLEESYTS